MSSKQGPRPSAALGNAHPTRTATILGASDPFDPETFDSLENGEDRSYVPKTGGAAEPQDAVGNGADGAAAAQPAPVRSPEAVERPAVLILRSKNDVFTPELTGVLSRRGFDACECTSTQKAKQLVKERMPIAALIHLSDGTAIRAAAAESLLEEAPDLRLIALVDEDAKDCPALKELTRLGALYDFHTLPADGKRLADTLGHIRGLVDLESRNSSQLGVVESADTYVIGSSAAMKEVFANIRKLAKVDAPVLITGESGTGKELAANAIHELSGVREGPFVAINCAALPPTLIESELFGYEKGAFTGAQQRKIGRIETAEGGTLFLDEIGDLPHEVQVHFLRFLQEHTIQRLGSTSTRTVNTRVVCATNVDLEAAVRAGRFREDLYYRLKVLQLHMPPLRERDHDIELLAKFFLHEFTRQYQRRGLRFSQKAFTAMRHYRWPGNVRELISAVRRAAVMADGRVIGPSHLGLDDVLDDAMNPDPAALPTLAEARAEADRGHIEKALRLSGNKVMYAARHLGVSRAALYRLMQKYRISVGDKPERAREDRA
jgi:DNA-binding NtrC family response regulator